MKRITLRQAVNCQPPHIRACDCREYRFQQMEAALKDLQEWAEEAGPNSYLNTMDVLEYIKKGLGE